MQTFQLKSSLLLSALLALGLGSAGLVVAAEQPIVAKAVLMPTTGSQTHGWVKFSGHGSSLRVWGEISGLKPGQHGFHVHEFGDCAAADGSSAGGHLAMAASQKHGSPAMAGHHTGDMGNITADTAGVAKFDQTFQVPMAVEAVLGRGLIVHEGVDDLKTQPSGDSGKRLACGVIGVSKN